MKPLVTRTTVTLDEDNALRLDRLRKERNASLKDVVNEAIRRGLDEAERPFLPREAFKTPVLHAGKPRFNNIEELKELEVQIQEDDDLAKLVRS
jgi:predicted transcriptional regulator